MDITTCSICYDENEKLYITECNHKFCKNCINEWFKKNQKDKCPYCRRIIIKQRREFLCYCLPFKITVFKLVLRKEN
jgi:hypothetical protein